MDHLMPARRPELVLIDKKERTCHQVNFVVPDEHKVKTKETEKDLAKELKKKSVKHESNIDVSALGTVPDAKLILSLILVLYFSRYTWVNW